jgi:HEAT repeat protein
VDRELELLADQSVVNANRGCLGVSVPVGRTAVSAVVRLGTPLVEPLRKRLASGNPVVRVRAACALAQLKVFNQAVADRLAEGYREAKLVDEVAAAVESANRTKDSRLLSAVRRLLTDRDPAVRDRAVSALISFKAIDDEVVRTEIGLLSELQFSYQAAEFLARSRERVKPFVSQLAEIARKGKVQYARWVAAGLLACTTPDDPAIALNLAEMQQKVRAHDALLQHYGMLATYLMGEKGFSTLCRFLQQNEIFGLPDFVSPQKDVEKVLTAEIRRAAAGRDRTWNYVCLLLDLASTNCSGESLAPCVPILIEHVCPPRTIPFPDPGNDPAAACLAKCAKAAVPALLGKLRDRQITGDRLNAIIACLSQLGPAARDALPVLLSNEMRGRVDTPLALVQAIEKIGATAECLPFLLEIESSELFAGYNSVALVSLGERALPGIVHLLESNCPSTRQAGAFLIFRLGKKAEPAIPDMINILARSDGDNPELVRLLATFGPPARAAVPIVRARLNSRYVRARSTACVTLARIAAGSIEARAAVTGPLLAATRDDFAEVRAAAADAIGLLGPPDSAVRKALEPLRQDSFATVRNAAERALHSGDARYGAQSKVWTLYFDSSGPATGELFSAND